MTNNQPMLLNCPACGAPLDYDGSSSVVRCKFCGNRSLVQGGTPRQGSAVGASFDEIREMVSNGNLQEAFEQMHTLFGVDAEEANEALDALKEGRFATQFISGSHTPAELTQTLHQIQGLLADGKKVEAVRLYRETFDTSMERALKAIDLIEHGGGFQTETHYETTTNHYQTQPPYTPPSSKNKGCRAIPVVLVLVILGLIGGFLAWKGGLFIEHYYAQSPEIFIPTGVDSTPQIASVFFNSGADTRFIGLVNPDTKRLVWQAAPLDGNGTVNNLVNGSDLIYAASEDNLIAYNKADGSTVWQTVMPDTLNYMESNLLVTAGRVITFNADRSIQSYNAETGSLVWSRRLSGYSDTMLLLGKSLVVVDFADADNNYGLFFIDPITGDQQDLVTPICTVNDYANSLESDTGLFSDETENALYLVFYEGCVQKLDGATRAITWNSNNSEYFSSSINGYKYLFTDLSLYFANAGNLYAVNKSNGEMKLLSQNEDYNLYPLEISGDILIVRADRTRGSSRSEIWGLDINSGQPTWQITMQDAEPIDPPDEMSGFIDDSDFGWTLQQTSLGLLRMTFKGEPNQLVLETINPKDGSIQNSQTIAIKGITGDFYDIPVVLGWQGSIAYLKIDSSFYTLDVSTGELVNIY